MWPKSKPNPAAHAAITALAADGLMNPEDVARAIKQWKLDPEKPNPLTV